MITTAQKAVLHIAKSQLNLDDDTYRSILHEQGGVDTSIDLTNKTFERVIRRLEELGFRNTSRRPRWKSPKPSAAITTDQQDLIRVLYRELGWTETARQMGFNKRCCCKSWPQTRTDAFKVIEGLKAMITRQAKQKAEEPF